MEEVEVGGEGGPLGHLAAVVLGFEGGGLLVEGLEGGEEAMDGGGRDAVVEELEEAEGGGGAVDLGDDGGVGPGEVDDGDGDVM